jgi:hypothetical protein
VPFGAFDLDAHESPPHGPHVGTASIAMKSAPSIEPIRKPSKRGDRHNQFLDLRKLEPVPNGFRIGS